MKISIITVVYNNNSTIAHAIDSVICQKYNDVEYIIIDGGSSDGTVEIIKSYDTKIDIFISEKDNGIYDAMNKGIGMASGDVIGILNSDDFYADCNVLNDVMGKFIENDQLDFLYGNLVYVKKDDTSKIIRKWISKKYYNNFFEHGNVPPHPSLFVKSKIYKEMGKFDLNYRIAADYEFMLRFMKTGKFKSEYINRLIVCMRLGGESNKSYKNIYFANKEVLNAWKQNDLKIPLYFFPLKMFKRFSQFL